MCFFRVFEQKYTLLSHCALVVFPQKHQSYCQEILKYNFSHYSHICRDIHGEKLFFRLFEQNLPFYPTVHWSHALINTRKYVQNILQHHISPYEPLTNSFLPHLQHRIVLHHFWLKYSLLPHCARVYTHLDTCKHVQTCLGVHRR